MATQSTQNTQNTQNAKTAKTVKTVKASKTKAPAKATKPVTTTKPATATKPTPADAYLAIFDAAVNGKFGAKIAGFVRSGIAYHASKMTTFPRARHDSVRRELLLSPEEAVEYLAKKAGTGLQPGDRVNQVLFDQLMVSAGGILAARKRLATL